MRGTQFAQLSAFVAVAGQRSFRKAASPAASPIPARTSPAARSTCSWLAPLERLGQPDDIARAVAFLAGPDAGWINGQTLRANGGII
jgi:NAD(P)-dependent dehydrogenase (short-subunit alcohol dehydrogenase family)